MYKPPPHTQDHMWSHRQEERELKRAEMEVGKQKKQLQRVMKNYATSEYYILHEFVFLPPPKETFLFKTLILAIIAGMCPHWSVVVVGTNHL